MRERAAVAVATSRSLRSSRAGLVDARRVESAAHRSLRTETAALSERCRARRETMRAATARWTYLWNSRPIR